MHPVESYVRSHGDIPKSEIDWLLSRMKVRVFEPGSDFCRAGDQNHQLGLLLTGLVRFFYVLDDDREVTVDFAFPVQILAAVETATLKMPSQVTIRALETSSIAIWPFDIRSEAVSRHPAWGELLRLEFENLYRRKNSYARALQTRDAQTRYREWVEQHPHAIARIPQYLIASYLGIAPQSLSRIRAQLEQEQAAAASSDEPEDDGRD